MSTEFKKGDQIVFVKDDGWAGIKMPEGTLGTYVDDSPTDPAPYVLLDTGERVRAWRDYITHAEPEAPADVDMWAAKDALQAEVAAEVFQTPAPLDPAEDHGTGDGSASDICAVPGCNCDLERRFPAPLDPAKVKPGDTVTLTLEGAEVTDTVAAWERNPASDHYRAYLAHDPDPFDTKPFRLVGNAAYTLTAHTPAPEPDPEPVTGHGTAYVFGMVADGIAQRRYHGFLRADADGEFKFLDDRGRLSFASADKFDAFEPEAKPE